MKLTVLVGGAVVGVLAALLFVPQNTALSTRNAVSIKAASLPFLSERQIKDILLRNESPTGAGNEYFVRQRGVES